MRPFARRRGRQRRLGLAVAVAALLAGGCFGEELPQVTLERVRPGEVVQTVSAPARVDAAARQDVAAGVSGTVAAIFATDGGTVKAGDVVVRLASDQLDEARRQAEAAQAATAAGGVRVDGGGAATLATVDQAVRDLDDAVQPQLAEARAQAAAVDDPEQRAAVEAAITAAEAAYRATRAGLLGAGQAVAAQQDAVARGLTSALNQAVAQAGAPQRAQAEAALAAVEAQAGELVVRAPFDGVVKLGTAAATDGAGVVLPPGVPSDLAGLAGSLPAGGGGTLRAGAPVMAGQTLFTVYDLSTLYVNADVDEFDAPDVAIGQRAGVVVDAFGDVDLEGVVESVAVEAGPTEAGGLGFRVRIRLLAAPEDPAPAGLRIGMTAGVDIVTRTEQAGRVVPSRALLRREAGTVVFVVRDGVAAEVPVTVTTLGEDAAAVTGDLAADDRVVVAGYEGLRDGDRVAPIPPRGAPG